MRRLLFILLLLLCAFLLQLLRLLLVPLLQLLRLLLVPLLQLLLSCVVRFLLLHLLVILLLLLLQFLPFLVLPGAQLFLLLLVFLIQLRVAGAGRSGVWSRRTVVRMDCRRRWPIALPLRVRIRVNRTTISRTVFWLHRVVRLVRLMARLATAWLGLIIPLF